MLCPYQSFSTIGLAIVHIFRELNKHAESVIVLLPSREKDGAGPLTVCLSLLSMEFNWFLIFDSIQAVRSLIHESLCDLEAVCGGYSCHLAGNTPSLDPKIYEVDFFLLSLQSDHGSDLGL